MRCQVEVTNGAGDQILVNTLFNKCHCFWCPRCPSTQSSPRLPVLPEGCAQNRCHLTNDASHYFAPPRILTGPCAGANFTTSEQQHHSACKQLVVFGIWNLKYSSFQRRLLQIRIHSCLKESKNPIFFSECGESVTKEAENSPFARSSRNSRAALRHCLLLQCHLWEHEVQSGGRQHRVPPYKPHWAKPAPS